MNAIRFSEALDIAARFIHDLEPSLSKGFIVMRDQFGRVRIAVDLVEADIGAREKALEPLWPMLGVYGQYPGKKVLGRGDFFLPDLVFAENPDIMEYVLPGTDVAIRLFERQITGLDWGRTIDKRESSVPRILFYGLKGGVGRSSALALAAYRFAKLGKKVLVLDLDLESPGLSSILLPPERLPEFGIVDWFMEDAVGQSEGLVERMTEVSTLAASRGEIRIASAYGIGEQCYLAKLSRLYGDAPKKEGTIRFDERIRVLIENLESSYAPDLVLVDSRAGLHDIAAIGITSLADTALLFATDSPQSWEGYRLLFSFWQRAPRVLESLREKLAMVYALFPEREQELRLSSFVEHSYNLFSSTLYQEIPAGDTADHLDAFNFDLESTSAPHYPALVKWNQSFLDFSEALIGKGTIDDAIIDACYGPFFARLDEMIGSGA